MNQTTICVTRLFLAVAATLPLTIHAATATPPDAGRTLQEMAPTPALPKPGTDIDIKGPEVSETESGGASINISNISIEGNSIYDQSTLLGILGETKGKSYDLAGLKGLANHITDYYRNNGYPFARAIIPAQSMDKGNITIQVIEGRYNGIIEVFGDDKHAEGGQKFLNGLKQGDVIESQSLERAMLLLSDQPGFSIAPLMSPGDETGTANLEVNVTRESKYGGEVGLDNYGNRYTGRARGHLNLYANSPFMYGDQIRLSTIYTEEDLWYGALNYNLPIGGSGLRAKVEYAHTAYHLGKEFSSLKAKGTAKVTSVGLSYPIIRSQRANLGIAAAYQYKDLNDRQGSTNTSTDKHSSSLPISLTFDIQDQLWGGGMTYGSFTWTHGDLSLDSTLSAIDKLTAKTDGNFDKFNLNMARIQLLPAKFSLYGSLSLQESLDNLDSSEKFGLGGVYGIRAYPSGEGFGDEGHLARMELRYDIKQFTPYAFYDVGSVKINHDKFSAGDNKRSISGTGLGVRMNTTRWEADAAIAWQGTGGKPESDTKDRNPMFWVGVNFKF